MFFENTGGPSVYFSQFASQTFCNMNPNFDDQICSETLDGSNSAGNNGQIQLWYAQVQQQRF